MSDLMCPSGKQPFRTKGKAIRATAKKSSLKGQPDRKIYYYQCRACGCWHRTSLVQAYK